LKKVIFVFFSYLTIILFTNIKFLGGMSFGQNQGGLNPTNWNQNNFRAMGVSQQTQQTSSYNIQQNPGFGFGGQPNQMGLNPQGGLNPNQGNLGLNNQGFNANLGFNNNQQNPGGFNNRQVI
jgi:hypothetical protein